MLLTSRVLHYNHLYPSSSALSHPVDRAYQIVLISSTLVASWLGMQGVHELGHVIGAWVTGAQVNQVVLNPLTISRTDIGHNPHPLLVVWAGPLLGVLLPVFAWAIAVASHRPLAYLLRFFAGFCLIANGAYIGGGSLSGAGDCGEMLRHGAVIWPLWLFGAVCVPTGLMLWNHQGRHFGMGDSKGAVDPRAAVFMLGVCILLVAFALLVGGE